MAVFGMENLAPSVKSPKSVASPVDAIVTKSSVLSTEPAVPDAYGLPPVITPLVLLERAVFWYPELVVSPNNVAFPVVAIVTKSIVSTEEKGEGVAVAPPANIDLVELPTVVVVYLACVKSPNI